MSAQPEPEVAAPEPEPVAAPKAHATTQSTAWGSGVGRVDADGFPIADVEMMSPEEIAAEETAERARVEKDATYVRETSDEDLIRKIFEVSDVDKDGAISRDEYKKYLKNIGYSKNLTDAQWEKECRTLGAEAEAGMLLEHFQKLYAEFRQRKLRVDAANLFKLTSVIIQEILQSQAKKFGTSGHTEAMRAISDSGAVAKADMAENGVLSPAEYKSMQAMLGASKAKSTKVVAKLKGTEEPLHLSDKLTGKSFLDATATLVITMCNDCTVVVDGTCTKVFMQNCSNVNLTLNGKVITHTAEVFKCDGCAMHIATKLWTLQCDVSKAMTCEWASRDHFQTVISAGCHDTTVRIAGLDEGKGTATIHWPTLEKQVLAKDPTIELSEERSQFKTHFKSFKLCTEFVVRLENGFPTTLDEKMEYERKQESNMKILAEKSGFTVARKAKGPKLKPNAPCECGSGKKQKKCCGMEKAE